MLHVDFLPWTRAVRTAQKGADGVVGFFPEYIDAKEEEQWLFSSPIGESPLGFVERSDYPVNWRQLEDLVGFRIGVVRGYVNERRFDELAAQGVLTVEEAGDDLANLRKLAAGRIDIAVIDKKVLEHLLDRHPGLQGSGVSLQFNSRILEMKTLHVVFRRDTEGRDAKAILERGLRATALNSGAGSD